MNRYERDPYAELLFYGDPKIGIWKKEKIDIFDI